MLLGPGSLDVRLKLVLRPAVVAVTVIAPALVPAVTVAEACPEESVVAVGDPTVALPAVTAKLTCAPEAAFPLASTTLTTRGDANAAPIRAVCPSPDTFWIPAAVILTVRVKVAEAVPVVAVPAVTVTCCAPATFP